MARKTQESGDKSQEPEIASPALSLDPDYSQPTVSPETAPPPDVVQASPALAAALSSRQGDQGRPFCGKHNCLMRAVGSSPKETRYACPVPFCEQKEKRARGTTQIPREPHRCPDIRCQGKTVESYLEVDVRRSSTAHLCMVCPKCGYDIKVPRPTFNSGQRTYERDEGDLAAR